MDCGITRRRTQNHRGDIATRCHLMMRSTSPTEVTCAKEQKMADNYEVLTEALRAHARKVDGLAGRLAQAVDAAREVSLPSDAYGICCLDLPLMLNPLQYLG